MTAIALLSLSAASAHAQAVKVQVVKTANGYQLLRNGQPYFIKGAGGDGPKDMLVACGGNSFRTWGSDGLDDKLAEAQKLGLTVTIGFWMGHKDQGFNYEDAGAVADQFARAKAAVDHYKNSPALLIWDVGNEMEGYASTTDPNMWKAVEDIAAYIHQVDPNHPTMTTVAELGGDKIVQLNQHCPDIDIVGINSYAGGSSIATRYAAAGGTKPYVLTEYGPPGTWELPKNAWGAANEPTSTDKANWYKATYDKTIANQPLSLGGYAFTWGHKQEATATWFGLLLPDNTKLGAVDALTQEWTGKPATHLCPVIKSLKVETADKVSPGDTVKVALDVSSPQNDPLKVKWLLQYDPASYHVGGAEEMSPPSFPDAVQQASDSEVTLQMPKYGGGYRLFVLADDGKGAAAVGNVPLFVDGGESAPPPAARKASLPLTIYGPGSTDPYIPSGYEGSYGDIKMDGGCTENPHSGTSCLKAQFTASSNWGGVVWQNPANNWGDQLGGYDLTGAKKLTFWARGDKGGEVVSFGFGVLNKAKFSDSGSGKLEDVELSTDWKEYTIDLTGQDLSRILTGFYWTLGSPGQPVTFYLDDIKFE